MQSQRIIVIAEKSWNVTYRTGVRTLASNWVFLVNVQSTIHNYDTVRWNPRDKRAFRMNHLISSASFNLKGCNLVCGSRWPKSTLTRNFSPIGPVVPEIWPNMWKNSQKKREKEKVLKMTKNSRKNGHYSKSTGPNQLKFCLAIDFGHRVPQTKFWLDCLKST